MFIDAGCQMDIESLIVIFLWILAGQDGRSDYKQRISAVSYPPTKPISMSNSR